MQTFDDTKYYDKIAAEMRNGDRKEGLWLKAITQTDGDEKKAESEYVRLRLKQLLYEDRFEISSEQERIEKESNAHNLRLSSISAVNHIAAVEKHKNSRYPFSHIAFWPSLLFPIWAPIYFLYHGLYARGVTSFVFIVVVTFVIGFLGYLPGTSIFILMMWVVYIAGIYAFCIETNKLIAEARGDIKGSIELLSQLNTNQYSNAMAIFRENQDSSIEEDLTNSSFDEKDKWKKSSHDTETTEHSNVPRTSVRESDPPKEKDRFLALMFLVVALMLVIFVSVN